MIAVLFWGRGGTLLTFQQWIVFQFKKMNYKTLTIGE